jgi:hypothetical protein
MEETMTLIPTLQMRALPEFMRSSFIVKAVLAVCLTILADYVFSAGTTLLGSGSVVGLLALLWLIALVIGNPRMCGDRAARLALTGAVLAASALVIEPGVIAGVLFMLYIGLALFLPRYDRFGNAAAWPIRLACHALSGLCSIWFDLARLRRAARSRRCYKFHGMPSGLTLLIVCSLTIAGSQIFLLLFSQANPLFERVLAQVFAALSPAHPIEVSGSHLLFLCVVLILLWGSFRPLRLRFFNGPAIATAQPARRPWIGAMAILPALFAFNLIFALQNVIDLAFLWGGANLPDGYTYSDYARQGTNALLLSALIAALFVLIFLRTDSAISDNSIVRVMVYAWIGQTVLLVFSCINRALNYIEVYSLTHTRIAALIFMFLVAAGLVLICLRIAGNRDGTWLVNSNALCLAVVLALCSYINFDSVIMRWNLRQSLDSPERIVRLDTSYLHGLDGSGALVPLAEATRDNIAFSSDLVELRHEMQTRLEEQQADWRRWTIAGAWRLASAGPDRSRQPSIIPFAQPTVPETPDRRGTTNP